MKIIKVEEFYKELKNYPVEMGMVQREWITEIIQKIQIEIKEESR